MTALQRGKFTLKACRIRTRKTREEDDQLWDEFCGALAIAVFRETDGQWNDGLVGSTWNYRNCSGGRRQHGRQGVIC
jgi:hypothetical protein